MLIVSVFLAFGMTAYAGSTDGDTGAAASGTAPSDTASSGTVPGEDKENDAQKVFETMLADLISSSEAINTEDLYVTITKPENDTDSTYEKSYVIAGVALKSNVRICLAKFNEDKKIYEDFANTDGSSSWDVAEGNTFSKEISLTNGANKIKIVAYSTGTEGAIKQEDVQITSFTISSLNKMKTIIKNTINNITTEITDLFKKPAENK